MGVRVGSRVSINDGLKVGNIDDGLKVGNKVVGSGVSMIVG